MAAQHVLTRLRVATARMCLLSRSRLLSTEATSSKDCLLSESLMAAIVAVAVEETRDRFLFGQPPKTSTLNDLAARCQQEEDLAHLREALHMYETATHSLKMTHKSFKCNMKNLSADSSDAVLDAYIQYGKVCPVFALFITFVV